MSSNSSDAAFRRWYEAHRREYNKKRAQQRANDPVLRERIAERQRAYRARASAKNRSPSPTTRILDSVKVRAYRIGEAARKIDRDEQVLRLWERRGLIPKPTLPGVHRAYTESQMALLQYFASVMTSVRYRPRLRADAISRAASVVAANWQSHAVDKSQILAFVDSGPLDFDPSQLSDARKKVLTEIVVRRGQQSLRQTVLKAYGGRCAVSGCEVEEVLETAHIIPYTGDGSDHVQNALLLRADLHTLFDLGLLKLDPDTYTVRVTPQLLSSDYAQFDGRVATVPLNTADRPSRNALRIRQQDPWQVACDKDGLAKAAPSAIN